MVSGWFAMAQKGLGMTWNSLGNAMECVGWFLNMFFSWLKALEAGRHGGGECVGAMGWWLLVIVPNGTRVA